MGQYQTEYQTNGSCRKEQHLNNESLVALIGPYYANNGKKLYRLVNDIVNRKFSGIQRDMDFFYSVANDVIAEIIYHQRYDPTSGDFEGYLYKSLIFVFIDEIKKENRQKRKNVKFVTDENGKNLMKVFIQDVPLEAPIDGTNPESLTYGDIIEADFDTEKEVCKSLRQNYSDEMEKYLDSLSSLSRKVAEQIMNGSKPHEIRQDLGLTEKQYQVAWQEISSYDKKRILYNVVYREREVEGMTKIKNEAIIDEEAARKIISSDDAKEKYKNTSYSIEEISRQMRKGCIRDDHTLQRHSGQWANFAKSELVADILRGKSLTQIIISEEYRGEYRIQWLIDGKQRCTVLDNYLHDGFRISKTLKQPYIRYQVQKVDENGNNVFDDEGFPEVEWKVADIRNKKFSQLPDELQFFFKSRQIPILYNMDCTKDEIISDISRFNRGKPMNKSQNGWLNIDEGFGVMVRKIAELEFFQPTFEGTSYTAALAKNGGDLRMIIEGIMTCYFVNDFHPDFDKICTFLNDKAADNNFTDFYVMVEERLTPICSRIADVSKTVFNVKDSFIWFGIFFRFINLNLGNDELFADFVKAFVESLHSKEIDGISFDTLNERKTTKDRSIVVAKTNLLENLMLDFISEKTGISVNTYKYNSNAYDDDNDCDENESDNNNDNDNDDDDENGNVNLNHGEIHSDSKTESGEEVIVEETREDDPGKISANDNGVKSTVIENGDGEAEGSKEVVADEMIMNESVDDATTSEITTSDVVANDVVTSEAATSEASTNDVVPNDVITDEVVANDVTTKEVIASNVTIDKEVVANESVETEKNECSVSREISREIVANNENEDIGGNGDDSDSNREIETAENPGKTSETKEEHPIPMEAFYAISSFTKEHFNDLDEDSRTFAENPNTTDDVSGGNDDGDNSENDDADNLTVEDVVAIANKRVLDFIRENVNAETCETFEDVATLNDSLHDYIKRTNLGIESQILNAKNRTPLLAMVQYSFDTESDEYFAEWLVAIEESGIIDVPLDDEEARESFRRMKEHFDTYVAKKSQAA